MAPLDVGLLRGELVGLGVALAKLELVEPRLEHRHALGAVAVLRAVVLALHDDAGGQVGDAHRRLGLVDVLPARAGGAVDVDAQVGRVDVDLDGLVDFRVDEHVGERGMAARVGVEGALAHQAVHAVLGAQAAVGVVAGDLQGRALDARYLALGALEHLGAKALLVAVFQVHPLEHRRPVLRLGAAGAGLDVHEAVVRVERVGEHAAELHGRNLALQLFHVRGNAGQRVVVRLGPRELEELPGVREAAVDARERADDCLEGLLLLAELLGALLVAPDARVAEELLYLGESLLLAFEVKDTSAARRRGTAGRPGWRRSG